MHRKRSTFRTYVATILIFALFCVCSNKKSPTEDEKVTTKSGSATWQILEYGFNFTHESVIDIFSDSAIIAENVNCVDIFFAPPFREMFKDCVVINTNWFKRLTLIGSPILKNYETLSNFSSVLPDSSMPAVLYLGDLELSAIPEIPVNGYELFIDSVTVGNTFAIITQDSSYGIINVTAFNQDSLDFIKSTVSIDWMYQPDGSRKFR